MTAKFGECMLAVILSVDNGLLLAVALAAGLASTID
jgi:hypothetical protein